MLNRQRRIRSSNSFAILALLFFGLAPLESRSIEPTNLLKCKYSVRDVGFVNVHSFSWQLTLARPSEIDDQAFESLDRRVRQAIDRSNVGHLWVKRDSSEWKQLTRSIVQKSTTDDRLIGMLVNSNDDRIPLYLLDNAQEKDVESQYSVIEDLIDSPFRQQVLTTCGEALCAVVLVESANPEQNDKAKSMLNLAMERIKKQMWELEKPTEKPPVGMTIDPDKQKNESWFLRTLGVSVRPADGHKAQNFQSSKEPVFAILYGQGRRLGELIPLSKATVEKLVARAAICGGDCECELDRDWLYGHQIVHRWSEVNEKRSSLTLNFDPFAALVRSEVAAIVRKASRGGSTKSTIDLGPGLIIHDLEPIERSIKPKGKAELTQDGQSNETKNKTTSPTQTDEVESRSVDKDKTPEIRESSSKETDEGEQKVTGFPTSIVAVLVALVALVAAWSFTRGSS